MVPIQQSQRHDSWKQTKENQNNKHRFEIIFLLKSIRANIMYNHHVSHLQINNNLEAQIMFDNSPPTTVILV